VKGKKEDKMLRALFRHKLENAEIVPSTAVSVQLMRRLRRREFLHFNPARFNIWYAGGIVVAGAALAFMLSSGSGKKDEVNTESLPVKTINSTELIKQDRGEGQAPGEDHRETMQVDVKKDTVTSPAFSVTKSGTVTKTISGQSKSSEVSDNKIVVLPKHSIVPDAIVEKQKLQGIVKIADYSIKSSVTEGCVPLKVRFHSATLLTDSCLWSFGDGGYSSLKEPEWLFDVPGEYNVSLEVYGTGGLHSLTKTEVTVFPKPVARFEISPENAVLPNDEITFHNFSANAVKFKWNFGDGNSSSLFEPKYYYKSYGNYDISLIATSENGCSDSVIVQNAFSDSGYFIEFPNAFIPNPTGPSNGYFSQKSDESSQVFHPVFNGVSDYQLRIFSRRGILIFESNDISIGWDGYFKGQLSEPGVYVWKVRGNFMNGEPFTKMGDVTLLKN
jgi:PKD repeat protein